jgi:hypothetical protein
MSNDSSSMLDDVFPCYGIEARLLDSNPLLISVLGALLSVALTMRSSVEIGAFTGRNAMKSSTVAELVGLQTKMDWFNFLRLLASVIMSTVQLLLTTRCSFTQYLDSYFVNYLGQGGMANFLLLLLFTANVLQTQFHSGLTCGAKLLYLLVVLLYLVSAVFVIIPLVIVLLSLIIYPWIYAPTLILYYANKKGYLRSLGDSSTATAKIIITLISVQSIWCLSTLLLFKSYGYMESFKIWDFKPSLADYFEDLITTRVYGLVAILA